MDLVGRPSAESVATVSLCNDGHPGECTPVIAPPFSAAVARTAAPATVTTRRVRLAECFIGDSSLEECRRRRGSADAVNEPAAVDVLSCYRLRELTWRLVGSYFGESDGVDPGGDGRDAHAVGGSLWDGVDSGLDRLFRR